MFGMCRGSGSGFVITSIGIGVKPKNCSGYYTIGLLGVQLELGEETSAFEDRDFSQRGSGTIVRDRGAGIGTPPVIHYLLPGSSPDFFLLPGGIPCPVSAGDDKPNNCSKSPRELGSARWLPPGVQPGVPPG